MMGISKFVLTVTMQQWFNERIITAFELLLWNKNGGNCLINNCLYVYN
jgi:hypothetical protein